MKKNSWLKITIMTIIYFLVYNLTRKIFLDRPFDLPESITGAIVFAIIFYLIKKYTKLF